MQQYGVPTDQLTPFQARAAQVVRAIQTAICNGLETLEAEKGRYEGFIDDPWRRGDNGSNDHSRGGGLSRVLEGGAVIEKGGVNTSVVFGELPAEMAARLPGTGSRFFATGVSIELHPKNPHAPTVHANFRYVEQGERRWFGGGADMTPHYLYREDKRHFHRVWEQLCRDHAAVDELGGHAKFRDWCDRYFYLSHRGERRGVGGIFFDYLHVNPAREGHDEQLLAFIEDGGRRFLSAYEPILRRRMDTPYTPAQRRWQEVRRGRYVEFNLLYDRGTVFGLRSGGRTESLLVSLPPRAQWGYSVEPSPGSPEAALLAELRRPPPPEPRARA